MRTKILLSTALLATAGMAQWTNLNSGTIQGLSGVAMLDPEVVWTFGENGVLLNTNDGGGTWNPVATGFGDDINAMMRYDYLGMLLFCDGGAVLRSDDLGGTWVQEDLPVPSELVSVSKYGTTAIAVGENGALVRSIDNGSNWSAVGSGTLSDLHAVVMGSAFNAIAVGKNGICLRTSDGGENWAFVGVPFTDDLNDVLFVDDQTVLICGEEGTVLRSTDAGGTWTPIAATAVDELNALWLDDTDEVYAVGTDGWIIHSADAGLTWSAQTTTTVLELTDITTGSGTGFAVGAGGTIVKLGEVVDAVREDPSENELLLYPNPSNGDVNIALGATALRGPLTIEVRTADGRIVDRASTERLTRPARMFGMTPGQYMVTVTDEQGASLRRNLIVQAR